MLLKMTSLYVLINIYSPDFVFTQKAQHHPWGTWAGWSLVALWSTPRPHSGGGSLASESCNTHTHMKKVFIYFISHISTHFLSHTHSCYHPTDVSTPQTPLKIQHLYNKSRCLFKFFHIIHISLNKNNYIITTHLTPKKLKMFYFY